MKLLTIAFLMMSSTVVLASEMSKSDRAKLESDIRAAISEAQTCKVKADCVGDLRHCPFGCHIYVNKEHLEKIKALLETFPGQCEYKCAPKSGVDCVKGKCKTLR